MKVWSSYRGFLGLEKRNEDGKRSKVDDIMISVSKKT